MTYVAVATLLFLGACVADDIPVDGPNNVPSNGSTTHTPNSFAAFRIYVDDSSSTRAFDGYEDIDNKDNESFNKGLEIERALYFPDTQTEEEGNPEEDEPSQVDESGDNTENPNPGEGGDQEENKSTQSYHFVIIFNEDGSLKTKEIVPLILDPQSKEDSPYYTAYTKFYDPKVEENPFGNEFQGTILVVLNASYDLENKIEKEIVEQDADYEAIRALTISKSPNNNDLDNFLYLKDSKGKYITDKDGHKYFTMSSSMIIDNDSKIIPAIDGSFSLHKSEKDAKDNPTSIYAERLQAKYTVLFKYENQHYYLKALEKKEETISTRAAALGSKDNPFGVEHLLLKKNKPTDTRLKIVKEYTRSESITNRKDLQVTTANSWMVNILGWDMNGLEKEEKIFKNLSTNDSYYNGWQSWAEQSFAYRNYWAEDNSYNSGSGSYPQQRRKVKKPNSSGAPIDDTSVSSHEGMTSPTLDYFDFNHLTQRNVRKYIPENTFSLELLQHQHDEDPYFDKVYLRVGSHLIVTAQLLIEGLDSEDFFTAEPKYDESGRIVNGSDLPASKYLMNGIYWSEEAYKEYVAEYLAYFMTDNANQQNSLFGSNNGNFYVKVGDGYRLAEGTDFKIEHAYVKGGDNYVYITPKEGITLYTFNPDEVSADDEIPENGEATEDDEASENVKDPNAGYHAISSNKFLYLVYSHPELMAAHYNAGMMYYAQGSIHNLNSKNFKQEPATYKVATGDYGTVRNNWYAFCIEEINNPGTGVDIDTQPIVPNNESEKAIAVSVRILDWHEKNESVDVSGQRGTVQQ